MPIETETVIHETFKQSVVDAINTMPPDEVAEKVIQTMMSALTTQRKVEGLIASLDLNDERERRQMLEITLAFLIESRFDGKLDFTRAEFDRWANVHPGTHTDEIHVAAGDGNTDDVTSLIVHYHGDDAATPSPEPTAYL